MWVGTQALFRVGNAHLGHQFQSAIQRLAGVHAHVDAQDYSSDGSGGTIPTGTPNITPIATVIEASGRDRPGLLAELAAVLAASDEFLVVRTSWMFGNGRNFFAFVR